MAETVTASVAEELGPDWVQLEETVGAIAGETSEDTAEEESEALASLCDQVAKTEQRIREVHDEIVSICPDVHLPEPSLPMPILSQRYLPASALSAHLVARTQWEIALHTAKAHAEKLQRQIETKTLQSPNEQPDIADELFDIEKAIRRAESKERRRRKRRNDDSSNEHLDQLRQQRELLLHPELAEDSMETTAHDETNWAPVLQELVDASAAVHVTLTEQLERALTPDAIEELEARHAYVPASDPMQTGHSRGKRSDEVPDNKVAPTGAKQKKMPPTGDEKKKKKLDHKEEKGKEVPVRLQDETLAVRELLQQFPDGVHSVRTYFGGPDRFSVVRETRRAVMLPVTEDYHDGYRDLAPHLWNLIELCQNADAGRKNFDQVCSEVGVGFDLVGAENVAELFRDTIRNNAPDAAAILQFLEDVLNTGIHYLQRNVDFPSVAYCQISPDVRERLQPDVEAFVELTLTTPFQSRHTMMQYFSHQLSADGVTYNPKTVFNEEVENIANLLHFKQRRDRNNELWTAYEKFLNLVQERFAVSVYGTDRISEDRTIDDTLLYDSDTSESTREKASQLRLSMNLLGSYGADLHPLKQATFRSDVHSRVREACKRKRSET